MARVLPYEFSELEDEFVDVWDLCEMGTQCVYRWMRTAIAYNPGHIYTRSDVDVCQFVPVGIEVFLATLYLLTPPRGMHVGSGDMFSCRGSGAVAFFGQHIYNHL